MTAKRVIAAIDTIMSDIRRSPNSAWGILMHRFDNEGDEGKATYFAAALQKLLDLHLQGKL